MPLSTVANSAIGQNDVHFGSGAEARESRFSPAIEADWCWSQEGDFGGGSLIRLAEKGKEHGICPEHVLR